MPSVSTFSIPFRQWQTWVRVTTPDVPVTGALPLIVLHGGPGMAHDYLTNLEAFAETGRTVIHYDQLGCGNSTHLPEMPEDFWVPQLFVDEFENLVAHLGSHLELGDFHLLGQSWGGMLGAEIAVSRGAVHSGAGMKSLSICNSPASMRLWVEGATQLRAELPTEVQSALDRHEAENTVTDPEYLAATEVFYSRHVCRVVPMPADFVASEAQMEAEPTVYHTMNGPNEFHVVGTLRDWTIIDRLHLIDVPTLVVAGEFDEATRSTWAPFVDGIADVTSHVFPDASHCSHLEQPQEFQRVIGAFLNTHDNH